ncbi:hypothetical protein B0H66DRAFT_594890 [Apodospora peruviana]|uniref:Uncharacterized protein n=1 Tax=Apodospora peruviana TaxID=516989 RepID=A0AAE0HWD9_9PEZI|nr:hypothetical protein B0H66DRAFT_594890 [Apodospora peruviana]
MAQQASFQQPTDLDTDLYKRLKELERFYSLAGFKHNYHTLSRLGTYRRDIVRTDDFGLHLVWQNGPGPYQFIKPLPVSYYVSPSCYPSTTWAALSLHSRALLYSYKKLIQTPLDFKMAGENGLLDTSAMPDWATWQTFVASIPDNYTTGVIESRFRYGDLRLSRLNMIRFLTFYGRHFYRAEEKGLISAFWHGYGKWVLIIFAYATTVLTAMQVALAADLGPDWFVLGCKWLAYVIIAGILLQLPFVLAFYTFLGLFFTIGWLVK